MYCNFHCYSLYFSSRISIKSGSPHGTQRHPQAVHSSSVGDQLRHAAKFRLQPWKLRPRAVNRPEKQESMESHWSSQVSILVQVDWSCLLQNHVEQQPFAAPWISYMQELHLTLTQFYATRAQSQTGPPNHTAHSVFKRNSKRAGALINAFKLTNHARHVRQVQHVPAHISIWNNTRPCAVPHSGLLLFPAFNVATPRVQPTVPANCEAAWESCDKWHSACEASIVDSFLKSCTHQGPSRCIDWPRCTQTVVIYWDGLGPKTPTWEDEHP